jgi:RNA polymerase-binding transcription factor DksA
VSDAADIAAETVEACTADAERRARGRSGPEQDPRFDGQHCVEEDCGVALPIERLNAKRVRCVDCQTLREKQQRLSQYNRPV